MNIINCKEVRENILKRVDKKLRLTVIQVEGDLASDVYIKNKIKTCQQVGIECLHVKLPNNVSYETVRGCILYHVDKRKTTGVMLQLPLPDHLKQYQQEFLDLIPWEKDVDGLSSESIGRLWSNQECLIPCTAQGVMHLLDADLSEKYVVIVGRSALVGKPLIKLLESRNATVTLCHSKTKNLKEFTKNADIVICAIGKAKYFNSEYFKNDAIVIDVGINRDENNKLCGDVDLKSLENTDISVTPTPGGTGILTTACLIANVTMAGDINER